MLDRARLEKVLDRFGEVRLLVVGDVVLDEYVVGEVERVSPEAPVPVVRVEREERALGGAANVARNVVALGGRVDLCGLVGDDEAGASVVALLQELGVASEGLVIDAGRPTTRKTRIVARGQQVVRFDRETAEPPAVALAERLEAEALRALPRAQGVVLEDYGKGALAGELPRRLIAACNEARIPVAVDPKRSLEHYRGADLVKPNLREAERLAGVEAGDPGGLDRAVTELRKRVGDAAVVVTRGSGGMVLFESDGPGTVVATPNREVFDVQGAGDTTIAALSLALRAGATLREAAVIANAAAGVVVAKVGTATAEPSEVRAELGAAIAAAEEST